MSSGILTQIFPILKFMIPYPEIDPVIVALGPVKIHWYGLMYLIAFASAWWLGKSRAKRKDTPANAEHIDDLIFYGALGVVLGGRIGSVLFYNFDSFLDNPLYLFKIWEGGMAFHGGFIGVMVAMEIYRRKLGCSFFQMMDFVAPLVPIGLAAGRLGNFINAELWGAPGSVPWAMKLSCEQFPANRFVDFAGPLCSSPRHPSQLYEFLLEGVLMFIILWWFSSRQRPVMSVSALFLICYGVFRSVVEFVRLPDAHIGFLMGTDWLTKGLLLSVPMILAGIVMWFMAQRERDRATVS